MNNPPQANSEIVATTTDLRGLHIIASLTSEDRSLLNDYQHFKKFIDSEIDALGLTNVGQVYHNFEMGGFTGVVCLSESHLSIHTWPELGYITFDVFLSNYLRDNTPTTKRIYESTVRFFSATVQREQFISR